MNVTDNLIKAVIIIAVISIIWALISLRTLGKDKNAEKNVKKQLKKGRVIYQNET